MNVRFALASLSVPLLAVACGGSASSDPASSAGGDAAHTPVSLMTPAPAGPDAAAPPVLGADAGVDASAPPPPSDAGATVDVCAITGGVGAPLYGPMDTTDAECDSQCTLLADTHPNRACLWGTTDLAPTGSCVVVGGAGASLYGPDRQTQGQCFDQCTAFQVTNVNLDCVWTGARGAIDITPEDTCTIAGGAGAPIFGPTVDRRGLCLDQCLAAEPARPSCTCTWGTVNLRP